MKLQERKGEFLPVTVNHEVKAEIIPESFVHRGGLGPRRWQRIFRFGNCQTSDAVSVETFASL